MSDLTGISGDELRAKKAELTGKREASKDAAARAALLAEINAIDKEFRRRALEAGRAAGGEVDAAAKKLDEAQAQPTDALSALGRTIDRVSDAVKPAKKDGA